MVAASDVVAVHSSGFGSDALVKGRLTVVLDAVDQPLEHGAELIARAGCPRATSSESLLTILRRLLFNAEEQYSQRRRAEEYVRKFCAYFGEESAKRIAAVVRERM
jgi:hypothetical protein